MLYDPIKLAKFKKAILILAALPLVVSMITASGYFYLTKYYKRPVSAESAATQNVVKRSTKLASDAYYIGSSSYKGEVSDKSKINKSEFGRLYKVTNQAAGISYITAANGSVDANKLGLNSGWQVQKIGQDPMWIPGSCAQKPSWLMQNRYVVIDDGSYEAGQTTHYYAVYDTQTKKFMHFGGSLISDIQAHENIMFVNTEEDKLVFYIDLQDPSGQFTASSNFKHSKASKESYIIRRVINPSDLSYDDYRVPYQQPSFDVYYTKVVGKPDSVKLELHTDGNNQYLVGDIKSKQEILLSPIESSRLSELVGSKYQYGQDKLKPYNEDIRAYLKGNLPQYTEVTGNSVDHNFFVNFEGAKGNYIFVGLPTGIAGGIPAIYDTSTHLLQLSAATSDLKNWSDASPFTMGTFGL